MPVMLQTLRQFLREELAPFEGRLGMTWRTAAVCALVAMVFMVYQIPLAAIACYLVLFVIKPNAADSLLMGIGVIILVGIIIPVLIGLAILAVDNVVTRMLILCVASFLFMYLSVASKVGEVGSIVALVIGFIMTLVGVAPWGEIVTRAILYAALMATAPMAIMILLLAFLGPKPAKQAQQHLLRRNQTLSAVIRGEQPASALLPDLRDGNADIDKMLLFAGLFVQLPKVRREQLKALSVSQYQLIAAWLALPEGQQPSDEMRHTWSLRCEAISQALKQGNALSPSEAAHSHNLPEALADIAERVAHLPQLPAYAISQSPLPKEGFFKPDVASNSSYAEFGLKVTFCAVICYLTYTALQWQDIHTAMITCYVAALGTVGETIHKLVLRISGCLVGAALGCASIYFLIPYMSNIGQLMALIFVGCMIAAWVAQGSGRISYAGVQIGLAFVLTILQGYGPDVKMDVALDRIYGILLGNIVLFVVFTTVWPVSSASRAKDLLQQQIAALKNFIGKPAAHLQMQAALTELLPQLHELRQQAAYSEFEAYVLRIPSAERRQIERSIDELESLYLQSAFSERFLHAAGTQTHLHQLQNTLISAGAR